MTTFYTSDSHFGHKNILRYNPEYRPYSSVDEMDQALIDHWNHLVKRSDIVYHLGDVSFHRIGRTIEIMKQLNGRKILIAGNHDKAALKSEEFCNQWVSIHDYLELNVNKERIILFHFPIHSWNMKYRGSIHLHGHCHGYPTGINGKIMDVGWDNVGTLLAHEEIVALMSDKSTNNDHHGREM